MALLDPSPAGETDRKIANSDLRLPALAAHRNYLENTHGRVDGSVRDITPPPSWDLTPNDTLTAQEADYGFMWHFQHFTLRKLQLGAVCISHSTYRNVCVGLVSRWNTAEGNLTKCIYHVIYKHRYSHTNLCDITRACKWWHGNTQLEQLLKHLKLWRRRNRKHTQALNRIWYLSSVIFSREHKHEKQCPWFTKHKNYALSTLPEELTACV